MRPCYLIFAKICFKFCISLIFTCGEAQQVKERGFFSYKKSHVE